MNKIVNGVANDYEFPMYYESNIKTSRDKDSVIAMTYVNQEKEIERLNKENKNLKEDFKRHIDRINELTNRIDKAIEYIENNWIEYSDFQYVDNDDELDIDCGSIKELLDILKGSDSNE